MHTFTIADDGDEFEKRCWPQWTSNNFPSYEAFWVRRIAPLTYRVKDRQNIGFRPQTELYCAAIAAAVLIAIDLPHPSNLGDEWRRVPYTLIGVGIAVVIMLLANLLQKRLAPATPQNA